MEEENKKPKNVPSNPDIVVKGRVSKREAKEQEERAKKREEELIATGMTREEAKQKVHEERQILAREIYGKNSPFMKTLGGVPETRSKPLIYKSGSGCMVALLIIIAPIILFSLLIF